MAHECPICELICHCHGDIDDLVLNLDADVNACTHCVDDDDTGYDDYVE
jgi:hypothetical protein